jgi:hypothetical protein
MASSIAARHHTPETGIGQQVKCDFSVLQMTAAAGSGGGGPAKSAKSRVSHPPSPHRNTNTYLIATRVLRASVLRPYPAQPIPTHTYIKPSLGC